MIYHKKQENGSCMFYAHQIKKYGIDIWYSQANNAHIKARDAQVSFIDLDLVPTVLTLQFDGHITPVWCICISIRSIVT